MQKELQLIKSKYGEGMMHFARGNFSTILETDGLLFKTLSSHFNYSKELFEDIEENNLEDDFRNYIYSFVKEEKEEIIVNNKSTKELLDEAGYVLYECKTQNDILKFRKYYNINEELCTFNDHRLNKWYVFFAVKKDVDKIKRQDFTNPKRQDLYGTSVISIQFLKGNKNTLSIKNRYNHTVKNPDATFSNNLDNIIDGLSDAFSKEYNLNIKYQNSDFEMPNYVKANDGKFYKYDHELNNIYYCFNNIIIDNYFVKNFSLDRYIVFEHYILDMKEKTIKLYDESLNDSFVNAFTDIEKIKIQKIDNIKKVIINENIEINLDKRNHIISYTNNNIKEIKDNFLYSNKFLESFDIRNTKVIGNNFLKDNRKLKNINLQNVISVGDSFCANNSVIEQINMPKLIKAGKDFCKNNQQLKTIDLPILEYASDNFISYNSTIESINLPNLLEVKEGFLCHNEKLETLNLPNLKMTGDNFILYNSSIKNIYVPNLQWTGCSFLSHNKELEVLDMPKLLRANARFLKFNHLIKCVNLPNLKWIGDHFLAANEKLEILYLPNVDTVGNSFCAFNNSIKILIMPRLMQIGENFMKENKVLETLNAPCLFNDKENKKMLCLKR